MVFRIREWMVACAAALLCVLVGWIGVGGAAAAIARGAEVYAFLIGIVAIAELARFGRIFEWFAMWLLRIARGSRFALFAWVYAFGTLVTILLSNDTTAVILAPAVFAAIARIQGVPRPYLFACAFVANAASFVLPISNPANLVVFGSHLPRLGPWFATFGWPSAAAIALTYVMLVVLFRADLTGTYELGDTHVTLDRTGTVAGIACFASAAALVVAASLGWHVGLTALVAAIASTVIVAFSNLRAGIAVVRHLAWDIVLLVAGLFVVVAVLDRFGALGLLRGGFAYAAHLGATSGTLAIGAAVTVASSLANNLPVGLIAGTALASMPSAAWVTHATMVAVDLGPNLAATGSLATMLWLAALRREGVSVTWLEFLRVGFVVVTPTLTVALLLLPTTVPRADAQTTSTPSVVVSRVIRVCQGICSPHHRKVLQVALQKLADTGFSGLLPCHCGELALKDVLAQEKLPSHRLDNAEIIELTHRITVPSSKWWPVPSTLQTLLIRWQSGTDFTTIWLETNQSSPRGELYAAKALEGDPFKLDAGECGLIVLRVHPLPR